MAAATTTTGSKGVGVPIKLFKEAESHPVTVELKSGDVYRGTLEESEDSMSCLLKNVHHTGRDGRVMRLEAVYLRGSQIRFIVLPEVLKGAPLFQKVRQFAEAKAKPLSSGRGGFGRGGKRGRGRGGRVALPSEYFVTLRIPVSQVILGHVQFFTHIHSHSSNTPLPPSTTPLSFPRVATTTK